MRFCGSCGSSLVVEATAEPPPRERDVGAERRQLTVLFCDLVGSTALSEQLDPEKLAEVLHAYQEAASAVVERFDGHVAQLLGDGLLVYLGYPHAHEDDPRRAVHTGLGIVEAVAALSDRLADEGGPTLSVRLGIHTGEVVAGEIGTGSRRENLALGKTPNVAARLQALALPGTVMVSQATRDLVRGFFELESLGLKELKGVPGPMEVFRVLGETGAADRFFATLERGLTPLVGRSAEMDLLIRRFERCRDGRGQVVLVSGEAGIGKTRLLHDLTERIEPQAGSWWSCRGAPFTRNSAFFPLVELVQKLARFEREDPAARKVRKLEEWLDLHGLQLSEAVPLLAAFLSVPLNGGRAPLNMTPVRQKVRIFEILLSVLLREPMPAAVFVMEDLQWVDSSTLEFLEAFLDQSEDKGVFTLLTARPSFVPPWSWRPSWTHLRLDRLSEAEAERLMTGLTGRRRLPDDLARQVVEQTDGVPLYVEEVTKNLLESGLLNVVRDHYELTAPLARLAIPTTLRDSLTARLDRLGNAKEVAQLASVIGRRFSWEVLAAISPLASPTLRHELRRLVEAGLVYPSASTPGVYVFKHALIRDAAHDSLLKSQRRQIHEKLALIVEERFPSTAATRPEVVARHFEEAELGEKALHYRDLAGRFALDRSAYVEAASHFTKALELIERLPESRERSERELAVRSSLGVVLIATKGYAAGDVGATFDRARELAEELGDTPLPVLWGIWLFHFTRGNREATGRLTAQLVRLSGKSPVHLFVGHAAQGMTAVFDVGHMVAARRHFEAAVELYGSVREELVALKLMDAGVMAHQYAVWLLVFQGQPDRAWTGQMETLSMAEELGDPFVLASVEMYAVSTAFERRETAAVRELAQRCIDLAAEQGFPHWLALARCAYGWALVREGSRDAVSQVLEGLKNFERTGARLPLSYWLSFAIDALLVTGRKAEGQAYVDRALAMAGKGQTKFYEGELLRLKGELHLLPEAAEDAAEDCFRKALAVTGGQRAKAWELRTAASLARLLRRRGRAPEAREILQKVYDGFEEGFETADLREAAELLAQLTQPRHGPEDPC